MLVPGILKLGRVSIMLQIWHLDFMLFFLPVKVSVAEILVLTSICLRLGRCLCLQMTQLLLVHTIILTYCSVRQILS